MSLSDRHAAGMTKSVSVRDEKAFSFSIVSEIGAAAVMRKERAAAPLLGTATRARPRTRLRQNPRHADRRRGSVRVVFAAGNGAANAAVFIVPRA